MADLQEINVKLRENFAAGVNKTYEKRVKHLLAIKTAITTHYEEGTYKIYAGPLTRLSTQLSIVQHAKL